MEQRTTKQMQDMPASSAGTVVPKITRLSCRSGQHAHAQVVKVWWWMQSPKAGAELRQRFEGQLAAQGLPADSWAREWRSEVEALQDAQGFSDK